MSTEVTRDGAWEVSIIVPCYNEGNAIAGVLDRITAYLETFGSRLSSEIVVIDDGSSDSTANVLQEYSTMHPAVVRFVHHLHNAGLTQAMRTGADNARKDTVVFMDADLSYAPETIGELLAAKRHTGAALAIASPYMKGGRVGNVPFVRLAASRGANFLLSFTLGRRVRTFTGMVRAYDTAVFREYSGRIGRGEFNSAMVAELIRAGLGIVEIPAALIWPLARTASPSRISLKSLGERALLVVETLRVLTEVGKGTVKIVDIGTLGLYAGTKGPYAANNGSDIL